jgi:hypothetical protein
MHLVALGLGISIASEAATSTQYPDVIFRPFDTMEDMLTYSAVWLPGNDNPALRRFLSLARSLASGAGDEAREHRRDEFGWVDGGLSGFATQGIGVGDEVAVYRRRQFDRQLDRLVVGNRTEFQLCHGLPPQP